MTVALPVTLPSPAVAGKAGSAAPGKGVASAPGQQAGAAGTSAEATEVAGMFAALVAALTQQMQPAQAPAPQETGAEVTAAEVTGPAPSGEAISAELTIAPFVGSQAAAAPGEAIPAELTMASFVGSQAAIDKPAADTVQAPAVPVVTADGEAADIVLPQDLTGVGEATVAEDAPTQLPADATEELSAAPDGEPSAEAELGDDATAPRPAGRPETREGRGERPTPPSGTIPATPAQPVHAAGPATPAVAATPSAKVTDTDAGPVVGLPSAPVTPTSASPAVDVAAPAPAAPAADPHLQIARVVRPLRLGDDGAYELALDLTPAELGRVRIDVELRGATINLSLRADNPATRELLQASLGQLRSELEAAGLSAGSLDIGGQRHDGGGGATAEEQTAAASALSDDEPAALDTSAQPATTDTEADGSVDVLA